MWGKLRSWIGRNKIVEAKEIDTTFYKQMLREPDPPEPTGPKYPPVVAGIPALGCKEILMPQRHLLKQIDHTTETAGVFETRYWPAIERYARLVHLLPASESHHHCGVGGLLHHGLEVGLYAMQMARDSVYGKNLFERKREGRERWLYASFLAGLCHDLGKASFDMIVMSICGQQWSPYKEDLLAWVKRLRLEKYYVNWRQERKHQDHEIYTGSLFERILIQEDRTYISEIDVELLGKCIRTITMGPQLLKYSSQQPYDIAKMVQKADGKSVALDRSRSRSPADFGMEVPKPLIRHYQEGLQRLLRDKWQTNKSGEVWVLGPDQELYLVWPRCGNDLFDLMQQEKVVSPADPHVIADIIGDFHFLKKTPHGDYYWEIKPANLKGEPLIAIGIEPEWVPTLIKVLPPGLDGLVRPNDGRSPWQNVGENKESGLSSNIIPLRSSGEQADLPDSENKSESSDEVTAATPAHDSDNPAEFFSRAGLGGEVLVRVAQDIAAGQKMAGSDYLLDVQVSLAWGDSNRIIKDYAEYTAPEVLRKLSDLGWLIYDSLNAGSKVQEVAGLGRALVLNPEIGERFKVLVEQLRNGASSNLPEPQVDSPEDQIQEEQPEPEPESEPESEPQIPDSQAGDAADIELSQANSWEDALAGLIRRDGWVDYEVAIGLIMEKSGNDHEEADFLLRLHFEVKSKHGKTKVYLC